MALTQHDKTRLVLPHPRSACDMPQIGVPAAPSFLPHNVLFITATAADGTPLSYVSALAWHDVCCESSCHATVFYAGAML